MSFNKTFLSNIRIGKCAAQVLFCSASVLIFSTSFANTGPNDLSKGKAAFAGKHYDAALNYFLAASQTDQNADASLQYNIAVCYFRLKQYPKAEQYFKALAEHEKWAGLAHYNLGLVAEAQGRHSQAKQWYQSSANSDHEKLQKLSEAKLARYRTAASKSTQTEASTPLSTLSGMLGIKLGEDSNAASLGDELIDKQSAAADRYTEFLGFGQLYVSGKPRDGLKLYGLVFNRQFSEFDHLNSQVLGFGLGYERPLGPLVMEAGARWTNTQINGNTLSNQLQAKWGLARYLKQHSWSASYLPSRYFADDRFQHIDGIQHRFEFKHQWQKNALKLKTRYRYEINDREDLQTEQRFASYSPFRHSIRLDGEWQVHARTSFKAAWEWTKSEYDGTNSMRDISGEIVARQRESEQWRWLIGAEYEISKRWDIGLEYKHTENDDNFNLYDYSKNEAWLSLSVRF